MANVIYAIFSTVIREFLREIQVVSSCNVYKSLILHSGTPLAFTHDAMMRAAYTKEFLPQIFFRKVVKSLRYRRTVRNSFIQRVIDLLTAAGFAYMPMFLVPSGENNDELFGAVLTFRPIRPNRII
jgi:hypothetical protein